ncbi:alpha/beta hydrolase family protein [Pleionea sediminis]|uniref:alpha/beta hydrolase family protein n=1 Tax=Pleionea sediminis TaxID=2569479 RepID=UPI0013DDC099|nr:S9 family peptidase [Pleionea sediminis]
MNVIKQLRLALTTLLVFSFLGNASAASIDDFVRPPSFSQVKISPDGKHLASTFEHGTQTKIAIMSLKDQSVKSVLSFGEDNHVVDYGWLTNKRLMLRKGRKIGSFGSVVGTADIIAINIDGSKNRVIFGPSNGDMGYGTIASRLPEDDEHILISSNFDKKQYTNLYKVDMFTGKKRKVQQSEFRYASNLWDDDFVYRFATNTDENGIEHVYFRESEKDKWRKIDSFATYKDEKGGLDPLDFTEDGSKVFMLENKEAPTEGVYLYDIATKKKELLFRHDLVDASPFWIRSLEKKDTNILAGAVYMDGKPKRVYFDKSNPSSQMLMSLESAFKDHYVNITSATADASKLVLYVASDVDPGTYYLYDTKTKKAQFLVRPREWINPDEMSPMQPISFKARDGLELHGYLTIPKSSNGKNLPLIVHPHGGPHGPRDRWGFNPEVQFYASLGYAVLQVNFRGSGGYGREFEAIGFGKWGQEMQDDLTDGTLWAIEQGYADKDRICIAGASYGGYASLMGVVREPDLYKCAFGYVGVYDLPDMFERGNVAERLDWGTGYLKTALGDDEKKLKAVSPRYQVDKIKADVFLATGGRDLQAHYQQTFDLQDAFEEVGKEVEVLFYKNEGHGFRDPEHTKVLYTKLKAFFEKNIGKGK